MSLKIPTKRRKTVDAQHGRAYPSITEERSRLHDDDGVVRVWGGFDGEALPTLRLVASTADPGRPLKRSAVMVDVAAASERIIQAYNAKAFDELEALIAPDLDFAHFNRDFVMSTRDQLLGVLRDFAANYVPDRLFEPAERVTVAGDLCIREAWYGGTAAVDLPGFGAKGEKFRFKFCSIMRFDDAGLLVEWKDHG